MHPSHYQLEETYHLEMGSDGGHSNMQQQHQHQLQSELFENGTIIAENPFYDDIIQSSPNDPNQIQQAPGQSQQQQQQLLPDLQQQHNQSQHLQHQQQQQIHSIAMTFDKTAIVSAQSHHESKLLMTPSCDLQIHRPQHQPQYRHHHQHQLQPQNRMHSVVQQQVAYTPNNFSQQAEQQTSSIVHQCLNHQQSQNSSMEPQQQQQRYPILQMSDDPLPQLQGHLGLSSPEDSSQSVPDELQQQHQNQPVVDLESSIGQNMQNPSGGADIDPVWLDTISRHMIEHMDRFGICVIDNFLGTYKGDMILKEVLQLYDSGIYSEGGLVGSGQARNAIGIRSDRVIWIDGYDDGCVEINNLIQTLCAVITNSSRLSVYTNNQFMVSRRTKAHVACYPGNGTRYVRHVDNPSGDGRVITAIYYINKNWNTHYDGGLLRMFPVGMDRVANIEPLFDRVIFFWSDRRNPHEVLPAHRDRFAITVWYIGESRH